MKQKKSLSAVLWYVLLSSIALLIILPLLWMLSTSFKPKSEWFMPDIYWIPRTFTWANFEKIFDNPSIPVARWFLNSVFVASTITICVLTLSSLAAYAYARMEFRGKKLIFAMLLATLFLPGIMF